MGQTGDSTQLDEGAVAEEARQQAVVTAAEQLEQMEQMELHLEYVQFAAAEKERELKRQLAARVEECDSLQSEVQCGSEREEQLEARLATQLIEFQKVEEDLQVAVAAAG